MPFGGLLANLMFVSSFTGLLISIALIVFKQPPFQAHANRLLSLSLLSLSVFSFISGLLVNHGILIFPYLFRVGAPLQYLSPPCAYLYVRAVLFRETKLKKHDWLFFVPFVLHVLELSPFYFQSEAAKLVYLRDLIKDIQGPIQQREGVLPPYYHPALKSILACIYIGMQWYLIYQFRRNTPVQERRNKRTLLNWLGIFTLLNTLLYSPIAAAIIFPVNPDSSAILALFLLVSYLLACGTILFFQPQTLYGLAMAVPEQSSPVLPPPVSHSAASQPVEPVHIPVPESAVDKESVNTSLEEVRTYSLGHEKRQEYRQQIEGYMEETQPFLRKGYTIKEMASDLGVPQHQVSIVINQEYGMNFNDFINRYRIDYIKEKLTQPDWRQLTLEGIALEAGFGNRTTFFRAFTKLTGTTPTAYLEQRAVNNE
ncbi:helix-turn-helix domain-containing protein [Spirosoma sp. KUDC1026]|uniref:helix-turn-helix domain-containing protein n=1 Tax=Spirosoma sp. KUDC1026 TaxID=2745947 RepID=UPI00159BE021|nr:helix-turn-helix domain-containing protein [Spirosoma sp. KUDC1026]QKZ14621.1 AraC family transcriptional regulator [Spirosoma sp. KUDC1026]